MAGKDARRQTRLAVAVDRARDAQRQMIVVERAVQLTPTPIRREWGSRTHAHTHLNESDEGKVAERAEERVGGKAVVVDAGHDETAGAALELGIAAAGVAGSGGGSGGGQPALDARLGGELLEIVNGAQNAPRLGVGERLAAAARSDADVGKVLQLCDKVVDNVPEPLRRQDKVDVARTLGAWRAAA